MVMNMATTKPAMGPAMPMSMRALLEWMGSRTDMKAPKVPRMVGAGMKNGREAAMRCFIEKTHEAYRRRVGGHFGKTIPAIFTDEPSLMAVNIGQLPEDVRKKVRVIDPLDEKVRPLPSVPWVSDVPEQYRKRYGEDLLAVRRSLFVGDGEADRRVRRQFWALVADLVAERYFGQIQTWCRRHGIASSGHSLWEENVLHHVPLEGNALKALGRMNIPGLDMLSSDPSAVLHSRVRGT